MAFSGSGPMTDTNGPPAPRGVYFLSLSLENTRCFGPKQALDLSDGKGKPAQWTILLGDNGTGKTTVLQALTLFSWEAGLLVLAAEGIKGYYGRGLYPNAV